MTSGRPKASSIPLLEAGIEHHRAGRLDDARKLYEQALRGDPHNAGTLQLLGLVFIERGMGDKGFQLLRRAVAYAPRSIEALNNLAVELCRIGRFDEALTFFDKAVAVDATIPGTHYNRARALRDAGRRDEALAGYARVIALDPRHAAALSDRGAVLAELGRADDALASFDAALEMSADNADIHFNRGNTLHTLGRFGDAVAAFDCAVALRPSAAGTLHNRGLALHALGRVEDALASYDAALTAGSDSAELLINRGTALYALGRFPDARACYEEALAIRPDDPDALFNLGNVLRAQHMSEAALDCYERALAARPEFPNALDNRGISLMDLGRYPEAARTFASLLALRPDHAYARGRLLHARLFTCDWSDYETLSADIANRIEAGERADVPFMFLAHATRGDLQRACAASYIADKHPREHVQPVAHTVGERIRIAYLSADFREHPVSFLMAGVFEQHDRARFETIAISFRPAEDSVFGHRVHDAFDRFIDVSPRTDAEIAALLHELGIDIAVDLMGHTAHSRTGIFARRGAPVQVNYLGYPGTLGADYIDAIIADAFMVPPESERYYAERVVRLPHCFQANDHRRQADVIPTRRDLGLPDAGFVFCAFNNTYKINPPMFAVWMRLLLAVPDAVLWLFAEHPDARANLANAAAAHGVAAERLIFAARVPYPAHLARLAVADLFLDTFPFNGGTTASDALWAGVPVVTCAGETFASRMAGSLLHAVGLPELVAADLAEYETIARGFATDATALAEIRERLRAARTNAPLFDTAGFCRELEAAFVALHHGDPNSAVTS